MRKSYPHKNLNKKLEQKVFKKIEKEFLKKNFEQT
jgi:hypothetical protein